MRGLSHELWVCFPMLPFPECWWFQPSSCQGERRHLISCVLGLLRSWNDEASKHVGSEARLGLNHSSPLTSWVTLGKLLTFMCFSYWVNEEERTQKDYRNGNTSTWKQEERRWLLNKGYLFFFNAHQQQTLHDNLYLNNNSARYIFLLSL